MDRESAPYSPALVLSELDREVRTFDLRLSEAALAEDIKGLVDKLGDLTAECAAQRVEISRLHGRILEDDSQDDLFQGRGWLLHLGDRVSALETPGKPDSARLARPCGSDLRLNQEVASGSSACVLDLLCQ